MASSLMVLYPRREEPTGAPRQTTLSIPALGAEATIAFGPFELKTVAVDLQSGEVGETDLLEQSKDR